MVDDKRIRETLLSVVVDHSRLGSQFQSRTVLQRCSQLLGLRADVETQQALLTAFHDLFRTGYLAWGHDLSNSDPPFMHLTEQGRRVLATLSRDPANPDGYMAHLQTKGILNAVAQSYIREALATYNANCYRAAAVMIGAAAESTIIDMRDTLVSRLKTLGKNVHSELNSWQIKKVLERLTSELEKQKSYMPTELAEAFEAYWPAFTQQIRALRNQAGHPASLDPVTFDAVHAAFLTFPELVRLATEMNDWIPRGVC